MSSIRFRLHHLLGGLALALASLAAHADFASDVTVKLIAPGGLIGDSTPISLSQTVAVADLATGVVAANLLSPNVSAGDIGSLMLDNERIFFSGNSIFIRAGAGTTLDGALVTGYLGSGGSPARYQIDGLAITGQAITGFTAYAFDGFATSGTTGLLSPASAVGLVQLVNPHAVSFNLDSLVFANRGGEGASYAEFRIDLTTVPVPEPATALLLAGGLLVVLRRRRG